MIEPHQPEHEVYILEENSNEFKAIYDKVKWNIGDKGYREDFDILNIFRIKNRPCEDDSDQYLIEEEKRHTISMANILFHGTSREAATSIVKNKFDLNATPTDRNRSKKQVYGRGIYLTNCSATALDYGDHVICCEVFLGNCESVHYMDVNATQDIPAYINSRRVIRKSDEVFVVKDTRHILPRYVITFGKLSIISREKRNLTIKIWKIRDSLTANSRSVQEHHFTSMYLGYIDMIAKKLNKDAPSEDIKGNVEKIYTEVARFGMLFASPGFYILRYVSASLLPESVPSSWEDARILIVRVRRIMEEATSRKNGLVSQHIVERVLDVIAKMKMKTYRMNVFLDPDVWWIITNFMLQPKNGIDRSCLNLSLFI